MVKSFLCYFFININCRFSVLYKKNIYKFILYVNKSKVKFKCINYACSKSLHLFQIAFNLNWYTLLLDKKLKKK